MEFNWSIAAWIVALLFVYIFGLVEGRSKGYKKRKAEEALEKQNQPAPRPETITVDDPGLLRIKNEGGAYTLDLDGARLNPASLSSDERKRLIEVLGIMRPWLEGRPAPAAAPNRPAPAPVRTPAPVPVQPAPAPTESRPGTVAREDRPPMATNSIVSQIDSILQARLAGSALEERGIFLTESPEGGVAVYVGLTRYNGIEDVPDPQVKAAIRAAIAEWEEKYTPGL